ncbi:hypothetical protein RFI_02849 [Reticulomyxa filosa]|uniref:Uncharacterized protein n=1 Tax=Reticulomyxa filosa TaxID=46433 RepID=X6P803_RETFI|nr:hypothetical protein RFI_02849 [Reticulomyxa filosa]|eukprot:ETO34243.1 hypothetical protein RFI_02849 [Reticulomyxa filosa]
MFGKQRGTEERKGAASNYQAPSPVEAIVSFSFFLFLLSIFLSFTRYNLFFFEKLTTKKKKKKAELTKEEMASYGFSDDEDSDDGRKRRQLYRSNVRTESNVGDDDDNSNDGEHKDGDEKSSKTAPVEAQNQVQQPIKGIWEDDEESDDNEG